MKKIIPIIVSVIIIFSCTETTKVINCPEPDCLCSTMEIRDFPNAVICINEYIKSLNPKFNSDDLHMGYEKECNGVDAWLDNQECVVKSEMFGGIIKTYPPQKCYKITFGFALDTFVIHLDLLLADTLRVCRFEYYD